ncbi:hypothetical protein LPJ61_003208 [Coemansia biformis]|uniref:KOW domain-containing protein n=1 Tax=Coemansia biformis TaxID=1286918 RepID=A0A9W7YEA2_9FUNG|nr:hypothetical protein LPJ61_003208 [Coemansia biformis]
MRVHRSILHAMSSRVAPRDKSLPKDLRLKRWKIVKGDTVMVISGKDRGKTGPVTQISRKTNSVCVNGLKLATKCVPKTEDTPSGTTQVEMPIHVSNVALIDPSTKLPTKVMLATYVNPDTQRKESRRYAIGTGTYIPKPVDLSYQQAWADGVLDTVPEAVSKVSFQPSGRQPPFPVDVMREVKNRYKKHF